MILKFSCNNFYGIMDDRSMYHNNLDNKHMVVGIPVKTAKVETANKSPP